jgi:glycosyltransferase involved in cell wall biosynthesis
VELNKIKKIDVTVIICTRNRALQLNRVLESACDLRVPDNLKWEFIIVDNGSIDNTQEVVQRFADRLPIRCVREENPGLSNARNKGAIEAQGEYICWTDDDVVIDPEWLAAYLNAFKTYPDSAIFGGRVIPFLEKPTPKWFEEAQHHGPLTNLLAYRDFGDNPMPLTFEGWLVPWGANFAIRAREQKNHLYNTKLGVSPKHKRIGEETDVIYRIFKDGGAGWWVPDSKVTHIVPTKRQSFKYLYEYSFLRGETFAYMRDKLPDHNYLLATGKPPIEYNFGKVRLYAQMFLQIAKLVAALLIGHKSRLSKFSNIAYYAGILSYKGD